MAPLASALNQGQGSDPATNRHTSTQWKFVVRGFRCAPSGMLISIGELAGGGGGVIGFLFFSPFSRSLFCPRFLYHMLQLGTWGGGPIRQSIAALSVSSAWFQGRAAAPERGVPELLTPTHAAEPTLAGGGGGWGPGPGGGEASYGSPFLEAPPIDGTLHFLLRCCLHWRYSSLDWGSEACLGATGNL